MNKTETEVHDAGGANGTASSSGESTQPYFWSSIGVLWRQRRLIAGITAFAAIASVVLALLVPRWYAAEARVLRSEGGGSLMGFADRLSGGLGGLLGVGGGDYVRYLAILNSRSLLESVVAEFDLITAYETEDEPNPTLAAVEALADNTEFEVDMELDYLAVRAYDRDPMQAAEMANFVVARLNEINANLSSQSARETRVFIERRLNKAESDLDSVRGEMQVFQETHGVIELASQAEAFMGSIADLKAQLAQAEVQYQVLARQYGPDNPQVQAARNAVEAARAQVNRSIGGRDELMPVAMADLPALGRRYAELKQDELIQAQIIETVYPLYEQAMFQERSEASAVQVVDPAIPPVLAARPSRRLIVAGVTLSALVLACLYALGHAWLRTNRSTLARNFQDSLQRA